jgi:4'-phosphopantetheinyl transferase EntD
MIDEILPAAAASAEAFADRPDQYLYPDEEAVVARAVDKRRREFTTGRSCARLALSRLGIPPGPILCGARGEPQWPPGITGAITHCAGYRAAAVARTTTLHSLGIDAEPHAPLPDAVLDAVARPEECTHVRRLAAADPGVHWDRLVFSAKESIYKAWFPLARRWLGFEDVTMSIDPDRATFDARLLVPGPDVAGQRLAHLTGRWLVRNGLVLTAVVIAAPTPAHRPAAETAKSP